MEVKFKEGKDRARGERETTIKEEAQNYDHYPPGFVLMPDNYYLPYMACSNPALNNAGKTRQVIGSYEHR